MRRPASVPGAAAAIVALALAAPLGACGDDEPTAAEQRGDQIADAARDAGLSEDVAEVLALAAAEVDGTFRVAYELDDPDSDGLLRVAITQRPPDRRLDVVRPDGTADATIAADDASYQCSRADGAWRCELLTEAPGEGGLFEEGAMQRLVDSLIAASSSYEFSTERRRLVGVEAHCLVTRLRADAPDDPTLGAEGTLCVSAEGARLLSEVPSGSLRATEYDTEIPDEAFRLPAEPSD